MAFSSAKSSDVTLSISDTVATADSDGWTSIGFVDTTTPAIYFDFTNNSSSTDSIGGLTTDTTAGSDGYTSSRYFLYFTGSGNVRPYDNSSGTPVAVGSNSPYTAGDTVRVEYNGDTVKFYNDGALIHTLTGQTTGLTLYPQCSIYNNGESVKFIEVGTPVNPTGSTVYPPPPPAMVRL